MTAAALNPIAIGDKILTGKDNDQNAKVMYIGPVDFEVGVWVGLELEKPVGKNDGEVQGKRYFTCKPKHGLFVKEEKITPKNRQRRSKIPPPPPIEKDPTRKTFGSQDAAKVKMELAQAVEDHDIALIGQLLPVAQSFGIPLKELENAQHVLDFEVRNALIMEMEDVRKAVDSLNATVDVAVRRAAEMADSADKKAKVEVDAALNRDENSSASPSTGSVVKAEVVARDLAQRMWSVLEPQVQRLVQAEVQRALRDFSPQLSPSSGTSVSKVIQEVFHETDKNHDGVVDLEEAKAAGISEKDFRDMDTNGDGFIDSAEFAAAAEGLLNTGQQQAAVSERQQAAIRLQARARGNDARAQTRELEERRRKAACVIEKAVRTNILARSKEDKHRFANVALLTRRQNRKWAAAFVKHANGIDGGLDTGGFGIAIRKVHPNLSFGQAAALWKGFVRGSGEDTMNLRFFIGVAEAVADGESPAAEIADVKLETWRTLGREDGDGAATKVQSVFRGNKAREAQKNGKSEQSAQYEF